MFWRILLTFFAATALASDIRAQPPAQPRTDSLGDPLPPGVVARLGTLRLKHNHELTKKQIDPFTIIGDDNSLINAVSFSPDGKKFASLGFHDLRLWETATGKQVRGPWDASFYNWHAMAFSPDGTLMTACGLGDRKTIEICIWDLVGAKLLKTLPSAHNEIVKTLAFTDDGKTLVSVANGTVRWWDIAAGKETSSWKLFDDEKVPPGKGKTLYPFNKCVLASGAKFLVVQLRYADAKPGDEQETIGFDLASRQLLWRARTNVSDAPIQFAYSADGKWVAVAREKDKVELRETATGKLMDTTVLEATVVPRRIEALAVSGDGAAVAISAKDAKIVVWHPARAPSDDAKKPEKIREISCRLTGAIGNSLRSLAFSPDNKTLLAGVESDLQLYDLATLNEVFPSAGHRGMVDYLAFSPDGKQLRSGIALSPFHPKEVITWDVASWKTMGMVSRQNLKWPNIGELPPEHTVYVGKVGEERLSIFDYNTGKLVGRLESPGKPTANGSAFFSPGCKYYAVSWQSEKKGAVFRLFAIPSGKHLCDLRVKPQPDFLSNPAPIVFSSDDRLVAFFGETGFIEVCDTQTGAARFRLGKPPEGGVLGVPRRDTIGNLVFSPDNKWLASWTGANDVIRIWDLKTGKERSALPSHGPLSARDCFAWSPDGRMLAVGHRTIQLWEVATMRLRREFDGHQGAIRSLAFSPDGHLLASGSADTTVLIWDVRPR